MSDPAERLMTVEEFFTWDGDPDTRYELIDGHPVAMVPTQEAHQLLSGNLAGILFGALRDRPGCTLRLEAGVRSRLRENSYFEPDLAVTCAKARRGSFETADPILIVEVLSPSTAAWDRGGKLPDYRAVPSVQEILLIDPAAYYAEVHRRLDGDGDGGRWLTILLQCPEARLVLESVGLEVPMAELYANVPMGE